MGSLLGMLVASKQTLRNLQAKIFRFTAKLSAQGVPKQ